MKVCNLRGRSKSRRKLHKSRKGTGEEQNLLEQEQEVKQKEDVVETLRFG